jgi:hypothetical protein
MANFHDYSHNSLDSASARMAREMLDSPSAQIAREMLNSPSARIAHEMLDSSSTRITREMLDSPSARMAREILDGPSTRIAREMLDGPSARMAREILDSPSTRIARDVMSSPYARLANAILGNSSAGLPYNTMTSPYAGLASAILNSPSARLAREILNGPSATIARELLGISNLMNGGLQVGARLHAMSIDTLASTLLAERVVSQARAAGDLSGIVGHSLVLDSLVSADFSPEMSEADFVATATSYLEKIIEGIRKYLATVQTLPALLGIDQQVVLLLTTLLSLYYTSQSATSSDINDLKGAINHQTDVIQRVQQSRQQFELKFRDVLAIAEQLIQEKRSQVLPLPLYIAQRAVPVKANRNMRSQTVGIVTAGSTAAIHNFDGKWIEIEFFDFVRGGSSRGWVTKKNFKRKK